MLPSVPGESEIKFEGSDKRARKAKAEKNLRDSHRGWRIEKIEESYDTQLPPIPTKEELNTDQDSSKEPDDLPF